MRIKPNHSQETARHYIQRINRAIDHIVQNLERPLKLEDIARVACVSRFHFHRVFKSLVGETLNQFVKRLRLERALWMLSHGRRRSLTEISLACGFASQSDFSRSFRERYGVAPSAFDLSDYRAERRDHLETLTFGEVRHHRIDRVAPRENPDGFAVRLRRIPARCMAYMRVLDPYQPGRVTGAAARLVAWAERRHLADGKWLGYMWDDPEIVALADCRYDVGLVVPDVTPAGEIGRFEFPAMTVAEIEVRGTIDVELRAMDWLVGAWLPGSGYLPADQPFFEAWIGRPFAHGEEHFELFVQLPVERR